ncbi:hypothetical protein PsorP6_001029 [Peronosclerospora sorghi]|uniref:Uncharacterized protein n=1 Tax=Peronosclerospora sorghi TaxID=230839 RepID=A0ACC0WTH5_9STRA|nr:hypothetical protein PsorP6_001029 [Peronosclerospora sorghi]
MNLAKKGLVSHIYALKVPQEGDDVAIATWKVNDMKEFRNCDYDDQSEHTINGSLGWINC